VIGLNLFYFLLIFDKRKNIFSFKILSSVLLTLGLITLYQIHDYSKVLKIMHLLYKDKLQILLNEIGKENLKENLDKNVRVIYIFIFS
jgi:hypothetical protein